MNPQPSPHSTNSLPQGPPASPLHNICTVFVDIDQNFLQWWGGAEPSEADALATARDWMAEVEAVYALQLPQLQVRAVGFHVHAQLHPRLPLQATSSDLLGFYQEWLAADATDRVGMEELQGAGVGSNSPTSSFPSLLLKPRCAAQAIFGRRPPASTSC